MKIEVNSKTTSNANSKTNSKKGKISPDELEMISGGTGEGFGQFTDIGLPSIWGDPHSKNEKGRLTG
jgi:hypothetical protein